MHVEHIREIREIELAQVAATLPRGGALLEIGAGAGWQAKLLADSGFDVHAIDVETSNYAEHRTWPVQLYDGRHLPFAAEEFDVVFSSNVLEHVPHVEQFQTELLRVLKSDGIAVHVLPTGSWRFWTTVSFYVDILKDLRNTHVPLMLRLRRMAARLRAEPVPPRHGEKGNVLSETYYFSRWFWLPFFRRTGWTVVAATPNRLFYTGYQVMATRLGFGARRWLSRICGSSGMMYVLRKNALQSTAPMRAPADLLQGIRMR